MHLKLTARSKLFISLADLTKNHNLRLHFHIFKKSFLSVFKSDGTHIYLEELHAWIKKKDVNIENDFEMLLNIFLQF